MAALKVVGTVRTLGEIQKDACSWLNEPSRTLSPNWFKFASPAIVLMRLANRVKYSIR